MIHDRYVTGAPRPQNLVDLVPGWASLLPEHVAVEAGQVGLFADGRVDWALERLGGLFDASVLELGPLEAGHTYQLLRQGARSVTAVEPNQLAFMRCLVVKELLKLDRASFLLGDFVSYLEGTPLRYDIVWASGVLYHMPDPVKLLANISRVTDTVFLWTHYIEEQEMPAEGPCRESLVGERTMEWRGHSFRLHCRTYFEQAQNAAFSGGIESEPVWMEKQDILTVLRELGYVRIDILPGDPDHPAGPNFCVLATR